MIKRCVSALSERVPHLHTVADALMALQSVAKLRELTADEFRMADMDSDGIITVADALYILRCVVNLAQRPIG